MFHILKQMILLGVFYTQIDGKPKSRIIGGDEVAPHSVPYAVAIITDNETDFCTGSLISQKYVLTAAHCLFGTSTAEVILGAHNWTEKESTQKRYQLDNSTFKIHHLFDIDYLNHDIGLIRLPEAVALDENIKLSKLPNLNQTKELYVDEHSKVYGWGLTHDVAMPTLKDISQVLRYVEVKVISNDDCKKFGDIYSEIYRGNICTSGANKVGHCHADSGGPLVLGDTKIGVTSAGDPISCESRNPSIYISTGRYLKWIKENSDAVIN